MSITQEGYESEREMGMRHLKMLGLTAMAAAALMAFVGESTASATTLTDENGVVNAGRTIHANNKGTITFTTFQTVECSKSTFSGVTREFGGAIEVSANTLTFQSCNCEVKRLLPENGYISITSLGNHNGSISSNSIQITVSCSTIFGAVHCIYETGTGSGGSTALGGLTGSVNTGGTAEIDIEGGASLRLLSTSLLCGNEAAVWHAHYMVDNPDRLNVD